MSPILGVDNLTVRYNGTQALEGVCFTFRPVSGLPSWGPTAQAKAPCSRPWSAWCTPLQGPSRQMGQSSATSPSARAVDWSFPVTVHDAVMMGRIGKMGWLRWQRPMDREMVQTSLEQVGCSATPAGR